jgi:hypothetical protein
MDFCVRSGKIDAIGKSVAMVEVSVQNTASRKNHTMLVLDCSGSMSASIDDVRRDSQSYVGRLSEDDFVSVIIFSGHGRARLISGPTQCNQTGKELVGKTIQNEVRILDTTVFSEPLELVISTVKNLIGADVVHNAVLFTDGCAVPTRWNVSTEHEKALTAVNTLRGMGVIVSVIGYGVYYDLAFIGKLMQTAGGEGVFRHISEIEQFGEVIEKIREVFTKTVCVDLNLIFSPDNGNAGKVYKTTPQISSLDVNGAIVMMGLYEGKATLFIELERPCSVITITGNIDGEAVNKSLTAEALTDDEAGDFIRVLGAYAFLTGDRALAAQMLTLTLDEGLAEQAANAYTERECREAGDNFRRYFVDKKFIGSGLKPSGPNHSVLNVLRTLIEDTGNIVYIPKGAYKRSGELTKDPRVVDQPFGGVVKVVGYRSHESRFNFSLLCLKEVKVVPEDGGAPVDMKVWRTYNLILDGNLHLSELIAVLSESSFKMLKDAGVIDESEIYAPTKTYTLNLRNLKMISPNWANPITLGLIPLMREEKELEAEQTALNAQKKLIGKPEGTPSDENEVYIERATKVEGIPLEYYDAKCCEYRLLGYKTREYSCETMTYLQADSRVKDVRERLVLVRFLIRSIVYAMELVGSKSIRWDAGKDVARGKYTKLEQNATFLDAELKRVTWEEQFVCS